MQIFYREGGDTPGVQSGVVAGVGFLVFRLGQPAGITPAGSLFAADIGELPLAGVVAAGDKPVEAVAWLLPHVAAGGVRRAVLMTTLQHAVLLRGRRPLPLVELRRGDEIRVADRSLYYSDEAPLEVVSFQPSLHAPSRPETNCSRCHQPIAEGEPVVFCPVCGLVYMAQSDQAPNCWTFGPCIGCQRDPHVEYCWHPDDAARSAPRRRDRSLRGVGHE